MTLCWRKGGGRKIFPVLYNRNHRNCNFCIVEPEPEP